VAGNTMTLEFAGDAAKLQRAAKQAEQSIRGVADSAGRAGDEMTAAAADNARYEKSLGNLGTATTGLMDSVDSLAGGLQAAADVQDYARARAERLARANIDVLQATEDMAQATRDATQANLDAEQASLDLEQARLDEATALKDYNAAVKEHGAASDEAKQAKLDMAQASLDVLQAEEDAEQATRDLSQANIDAKEAQINLNSAMHEANPPQLATWAEQLSLITPLLTAMIGVTSLVTVAQWAWNAAQLASPTTWIVLGIVALIAVIVLLVKNWDTVAAAAGKAWDWIKKKAADAWGYLKTIPGKVKDHFAAVGRSLSAPFKAAFNAISDAWNGTVGRLSWSVPGWVPGIGGNNISAPRLPKFHSGGMVPGAPGSEMLAILQAGEEVIPAGRASGGEQWLRVDLGDLGDALVASISKAMATRYGGRIEALGVKVVR
jgi:hypothetical protein